ncbi:MAG: D-alanyl-D-alanine carboxypeptidase [Clostridia bacterium]|nr:D-alanyl-D-alanine carboxypeptidase [Clostridia bacterium]
MAADTGEVIFEKDPDEIRYPASTTKILTVLLGIIMVDDVYQYVTVSDTAVAIPEDSSSMHLHAGEEIRFIDVLYGTMLVSGNDGANVIAETVSGSIPAFVELMNSTAQMYGCTNTHFMNPHGYHDDNHYSTARDLAIISREALQNDLFCEIAASVTWSIPKTNMQRARTITTKSKYMIPATEESPNKYYYPYAIGIKTGSHSQSGYCFAGAADKDGVRLVSVVMFTGDRARWADTIKLMDYGFSQYISVTPMDLYNMNPITIETNNYSTSDPNRGKILLSCQLQNPESVSPKIVSTSSEVKRMAANLKNIMVFQYTRDFSAPITAGETIGTMTYYPQYGDPVVYLLTASRSVARRENVPKTLEEIVNETYADPNPLPPFSFNLLMIFLSPVIVIGILIGAIIFIRKRQRAHRMKAPKPSHRYVK